MGGGSSLDAAKAMGFCPQHMSVIGIFGETSAMAEAVKAVEMCGLSDRKLAELRVL